MCLKYLYRINVLTCFCVEAIVITPARMGRKDGDRARVGAADRNQHERDEMVRAIDWRDNAVVIIDLTRLPEEELTVALRTPEELVNAIRRMAVRGAMALGVAGAFGVALGAVRAGERSADVRAAAHSAAAALAAARPTAANLAWGAGRALAAIDGGAPAVVAAALAVRDADIEANRAIARRGADLLAGTRRVLTHCNTGALAAVEYGTGLGVIGALHRRRPLDMVYVSETRPLLQGSRLTAWELAQAGIPYRILVDSASAGLILGGGVDAVVVGADRIAANGDVANKVGTLAHALAARRAGIPFIVAAPEATFSVDLPSGADIPIEERDPHEVLELRTHLVAPRGSRAYNPAFDVTPADLVTAIVSETRILYPAAQALQASWAPVGP